jgi:hypothetical protein
MGFYEHTPSPSSPVLVLQSQHPQPYNMTSNNLAFNTAPFGHESPTPTSWSQPMQQACVPSAAGRKRSRDEAADDLEDSNYFASTATSAPKTSEEDWEYGEGMTLIKPNGFIIDASSQTGTWAEEKAELMQPSPVIQDRPVLRSFKSQRLDLTATPSIAEEINLTNGSVVALSPPKTTTEDPTVDAFTVHLGIGWSRISEDEHIQAAARGWARFVENHYPLSNVQIRLQSKGLASYLVQASEGFFLFAEDLKQGRLVSVSLGKTFENLKTSPPEFESDEVIMAVAETPKMEAEMRREILMNEDSPHCLPREEVKNGGTESYLTAPEVTANRMHNVRDPAGQELDVEMDVS